MSSNNPMAIYCSACGAPAEFDILKQSYHCAYCGADTEVGRAVNAFNTWRETQKTFVYRQSQEAAEAVVSCSQCGATVMIPESEVLNRCDYCGAQVVRRSYVEDSDQLPEVIIPFYITQEEAADAFRKWQKRRPFNGAAKHFRGREAELKAYYLPYELLRGPIRCKINREKTEREYFCQGYLDGVAVNCSSQLDNPLLDAVEPFDWEEAVPFSFAYVAGHKAKLADLSGRMLDQRIQQEVQEDYQTTVDRVMQSSNCEVQININKTYKAPALLPVYLIKDGPYQAAVNGQTGKVAATDGKVKKQRSWLIEPTLLTLLVALIAFLVSKDLELTLLSAFVFGIPVFIALAEGRGPKLRRSIAQGRDVRALRGAQGVELLKREKQNEERYAPVFVEPVEQQAAKVRVKFYTFKRVLFGILMILAIAGFPYWLAIIGMGIASLISGNPSLINQLFWGGGAAWLCLMLPISFFYTIIFGRVKIYEYPYFFEAKPQGRSGRRLYSDRDPENYLFDEIMSIMMLRPVLIGLIIFALISVLVMVYPM